MNSEVLKYSHADVLQTLLFFNTPFVQSGNAALAVVTRSRAAVVKMIHISVVRAFTTRFTWGYLERVER